MKRYAVFILPQAELRSKIIDWKNRVEALLPTQPYCSHLPHSTLYISSLKEPHHWMDSLVSELSSFNRFELSLNKHIIFYDDLLTGGGHTIAFRVDNNEKLFSLQQAVAETLSAYLSEAPINNMNWQAPFSNSLMKYGSPFVGEHWIAHFTVASLKTNKDHPLIQEFSETPFSYSTSLEQLAVYKVEGEEHTHLETINLKGTN